MKILFNDIPNTVIQSLIIKPVKYKRKKEKEWRNKEDIYLLSGDGREKKIK
jgi:hypothetical protein